jgi:hypothetical protein
MSCQAWQDLLQHHLDQTGAPDELERHLTSCPDCARERPTIQRLLDGLRLLHPPTPPADLADRITTRVLAEARHRPVHRWRRRAAPLVALAAAAAILLLLGLRLWRPGSPSPDPRVPDPDAIVQPKPAAPLRDSMEGAQSAVVALTSRTASETVETTATLLPLVPPTTLEPLTPRTTSIEPPMEPFREATSGVSATVAPVADSARRAVGLFLRDLPMGRAPLH